MVSIEKIYYEVSAAREQYDSWFPWHCSDPVCEHHMCVVRRTKVRKLRTRLDILTYMYATTLRRQRGLSCIDSAMIRALSFQNQ